MTALIPTIINDITIAIDKARDYIDNAKAMNTKRAYASDWRHFTAWCRLNCIAPLPSTPENLCIYLTTMASSSRVSTIQRRLTAIGQAHQAAGLDSPTGNALVRNLMAGIRREKGTRQLGKAPLLIEDLKKLVFSLSASAAGVRDKAILILGYAGGFRRSELISIDVDDVSFEHEGIVVLLRKSKTDQIGEGRKIGIPFGNHPGTCPVLALKEWLTVSGINEGAIFRAIDRHGRISKQRLSDHSVALILKRTAEAVGINPTKYSGHSLRAGFATQAAINGVSEVAIMSQTGHKSVNMLRRYVRDGNLFRNNPAGQIGL